MSRLVLIASLIANAWLGFEYARTAADYARLSDWACAHGNGGHECGEE